MPPLQRAKPNSNVATITSTQVNGSDFCGIMLLPLDGRLRTEVPKRENGLLPSRMGDMWLKDFSIGACNPDGSIVDVHTNEVDQSNKSIVISAPAGIGRKVFKLSRQYATGELVVATMKSDIFLNSRGENFTAVILGNGAPSITDSQGLLNAPEKNRPILSPPASSTAPAIR